MKSLAFVSIIGGAIGAFACGGDSSGPSGPRAASVTGIAGDSQVAPTNVPLDFPLSMTLLGSNGQPIQGVSVTWSAVPANGASFSPQPSVSDANGIAATTVTMGAIQDTIVINAAVPGVAQPVVFHALAVDPCTFARLYTFGSTVNGALTTVDCNAGGYYTDLYAISFAAQTGLTINMTGNFDTWIDWYHDNGSTLEPIGFHDDIAFPGNLNSRLQAVVSPGDYILAPNTANAGVTGAYQITSSTRAQRASGCGELWVTRGVILADSIAAGDCPDTTGVGSYGDSLKIILLSGTVLKVAARSGAVNPRLALFRVIFKQPPSTDSLFLAASNDDSSGTTTNAFVSYTASQGAVFIIFAGTTGTGQTGPYTLDISSSTTLSGAARSNATRRTRVGALPQWPAELELRRH